MNRYHHSKLSKQSTTINSVDDNHAVNTQDTSEILNYKGFSQKRFLSGRFTPFRGIKKNQDLLSGLEKACKNNELRIYYQPIISFILNKPVCFEALVRWNHPEAGLINPSYFIPYAESHGLIKDIGKWVIKHACMQLKEWQIRFPHDPEIAVSVNISPRQLDDSDLIGVVLDTLEEHQPAQGTLIFEITESSIINNVEIALDVLTLLKSLGVKVSLDDFGTGYSSLNVLQRFPFDNIKLDRSYIKRMFKSKNDFEYISKSFELGLKLNKEVVAEGIETMRQQSVLQDMQCKFGQGYLYSKPVTSKRIDKMLNNGIQCLSV